jgi:hypothetical protein
MASRWANFRRQGNGQGAVSTRAYVAELPSLIDEIDTGGIAVTTRPAPLADVETAWTAPEVPGCAPCSCRDPGPRSEPRMRLNGSVPPEVPERIADQCGVAPA